MSHKLPRFRSMQTNQWRDDDERSRLVEQIIELKREVDSYRATASPRTSAARWSDLHSLDDIAREKAIRADQRRLDLRELQATARHLDSLLEQFTDIDKPSDIDPVKLYDALVSIRSHARRLITVAERRSAA